MHQNHENYLLVAFKSCWKDCIIKLNAYALPPRCCNCKWEIVDFLWALRFWVYQNIVDAVDTAVVESKFAEMVEIIIFIIDRIYKKNL